MCDTSLPWITLTSREKCHSLYTDNIKRFNREVIDKATLLTKPNPLPFEEEAWKLSDSVHSRMVLIRIELDIRGPLVR
jgi:hypothetical protein